MNEHAKEHLAVAQMHVHSANATLPWIRRVCLNYRLSSWASATVAVFAMLAGFCLGLKWAPGFRAVAVHEYAAQQEVRP